MRAAPAKTEALIYNELRSTERVVWKSAPNPRRVARKGIPVVLFGIPWTAFALFWTAGASGFKLPDFGHPTGWFALFGVPFILIGLGMLTAPLWLMRKAAGTAYVITNQRVIIFEPSGRDIAIRSIEPQQLQNVRRVQRADGSGDLLLTSEVTTNKGRGTTTDIGFFGIADVKSVESMVTALGKSATT